MGTPSRRHAGRKRGVLVLVLGSVSTGCLYPPDPPDGGLDAGIDAGLDGTTTTEGGIPVFNNCTQAMFVDQSMGDRTISFGGMNNSPLFGYAPPCMRITVGQSVTFSGSFNTHPLIPGISPVDMTAGSSGNPIPPTFTGNMVMVSFPAAGVYPYACQMHYAAGMSGVIWVQ